MGEQGKRGARSPGGWLRNAVLVALTVLLGMCCYFVFRLSMLAYRVEQSVAEVAADVKAVTATVATLSADVAAIREDILALKSTAQEYVPYEEVRHMVDEVLAFGEAVRADSSALPESAEVEIRSLLNSLLVSGQSVEVGGESRSVARLYAELYAKYKLKKRALSSAEDFIDEVGTQTMSEETYYLVDEDGTRVHLSTWLGDRLGEIREEAEAGDQGDN